MVYSDFTLFYNTCRLVVSFDYEDGLLTVTVMNKDYEEWEVLGKIEETHNTFITPFNQFIKMLKTLHKQIKQDL